MSSLNSTPSEDEFEFNEALEQEEQEEKRKGKEKEQEEEESLKPTNSTQQLLPIKDHLSSSKTKTREKNIILQDEEETEEIEEIEEEEEEEINLKSRNFKINCLYFSLFASYACVSPFLPVYFASLGFSKTQIGILGSLQPFVSFLGGTLGTFIADATRKHKMYFILSIFISSLLRVCLMFPTQFSHTLGLLLICEITSSSVFPLMDNGVLEMLGKHSDQYGKMRLWGAVGWGIVATIVGVVITLTDLRIIFYSHGALTIFSILFALCLPMTGKQSKKGKASKRTQVVHLSLFERLRNFLKFEILSFLVIVFVMGYANGTIVNQLFVYLRELGANESLFGVAVGVMCVVEVPFFFYSERLISKIKVSGVIVFSMSCYVIRLVYYALFGVFQKTTFFENEAALWIVLPAEALHGITFAATWAACVYRGKQVAPQGFEGMMQGLVAGVHWGLGTGIGSAVAGVLADTIGSAATFATTAIFIGLTLFGYTLSILIPPLISNSKQNRIQKDQINFVPLNQQMSNDKFMDS